MSKVKIQGNASGTGVLTIEAPNTNTDRTITLPDSTGTLVGADASGNVGIGTSSPSTKLTVWDAVNRNITSSDGQFRIKGSGYDGYFALNGISFQIGQNSNSRSLTFHSGSGMPERLRIDSAGRVTMPYQPYAKVDFGGSAYVTYNTGLLPFDNIAQNTGNHYDTTTYKFTCPVSGIYAVNFSYIRNDLSTHNSMFNVRKNGSYVGRFYRSVYQLGASGTLYIKCSANDTLDIYTGYSNSIYEGGTSDPYTWADYLLIS